MSNNFLILLESEYLPFYDLVGSDIPGLLELPRTEDSHSDAIFIPNGLVFGDEIVTQVYVSFAVTLMLLYTVKTEVC